MFKKISLPVFFLLFFIIADASAQLIKNNELLYILNTTNEAARQKELVKFVRSRFENMPFDGFQADRAELRQLLAKHDVSNSEIIDLFIESIYLQRVGKVNESINIMTRAINEAGKIDDHFLLYSFFSRLAFIEASIGNSIQAISSFRMASKEAIVLNEPYLQITIGINISDIYYKNSFYSQSLLYLKRAQDLLDYNRFDEQQRLQNVIYINKAENFFRMKNLDSLKKYNRILHQVKDGTYRIAMFRSRTDYYLSILQRNYKSAIAKIQALKLDSTYRFDVKDWQSLAKAYYYAGMNDSAKAVTESLLTRSEVKNHPEITSHLYELLGEIAQQQGDQLAAAGNFKTALNQALDQTNRLTQMGNISSQIKVDEMQDRYIQKEANYKRERTWLISLIVIAVLFSGMVFMIYRNSRQKQYYEKLLFNAKREELSFINSHEVRKHLSNILGLINIIKQSDNKQKTYQEVEDYLLDSSECLDKAIESISKKLDD